MARCPGHPRRPGPPRCPTAPHQASRFAQHPIMQQRAQLCHAWLAAFAHRRRRTKSATLCSFFLFMSKRRGHSTERLVDGADAQGAVSYSRGDPLGGIAPHVADGEDVGTSGFEEHRVSAELFPVLGEVLMSASHLSGYHESFLVEAHQTRE